MWDVSDPEFRVLNVRQPWATALVRHVKDVENRPRELPADGLWVAVLASAHVPTAREMDELHTRMAASGHPRDALPTDRRAFPTQRVVGVVRFRRPDDGGSDSAWYLGPPHHAWVVDHAHALEVPFGPVQGSLALRRLSNFPEPLRGALREALRSTA